MRALANRPSPTLPAVEPAGEPGRVDVRAVMAHFGNPLKLLRREIEAVSALAWSFRVIGDRVWSPQDEVLSPEQARELVARLPSVSRVMEGLEIVRVALDDPVREDIGRLLIGLMLDVLKAKVSENTSVFVDAAVFMIEDEEKPISAEVLAAAVRKLWSERTFAPSVAEVLEACRARRAETAALGSALKRLASLHRALRRAADTPQALPQR